MQLLDGNERQDSGIQRLLLIHGSTFRTGRLTWHEGLIPASEMWLKVGGDKGGGICTSGILNASIIHLNDNHAIGCYPCLYCTI